MVGHGEEGRVKGKVYHFEATIREPYMGNQVPLKVRVLITSKEKVVVYLENPEGIVVRASVDPDV